MTCSNDMQFIKLYAMSQVERLFVDNRGAPKVDVAVPFCNCVSSVTCGLGARSRH